MPDHVPDVPGRPEAQRESFAFAYGYIRGLLQSLDA
jgi:mannonate dehydratase